MNKRYALPLAAALGGAAACVLRLLQNSTGYEPDTRRRWLWRCCWQAWPPFWR